MRLSPDTALPALLLKISLLVVLCVTGLAQERPREEVQDQQESIRIGTSLVTVPVIVTDPYGRLVRGLSRTDFAIREDGISQRIENFSAEEAPFDVALLIDTSRSTQNKLSSIRKAAIAFFKQLQPRDRVMIVTFDEKVRFINDFTNNPVDLDRAVRTLKSSYLTSLYDAIKLTVTEKLAAARGRKAIVVLTDGVDTASKQATFESTLDLIASSGIIAYTIQYETRNDGAPLMKPIFLPGIPNGGASSFVRPFRQQDPAPQSEASREGKPIINLPIPTGIPVVGSDVNRQGTSPGTRPSTRVNTQTSQPIRDRYLIAADFLRSLAVQSGARYIRAENIENTSFAFQLIAQELRYQYTLSYISSNEKRDGSYRSIVVNVGRDGLIVRARLGYRSPLR
ncbi:MAG: VWA domain-containing protein [Blastocatellia bacterium]